MKKKMRKEIYKSKTTILRTELDMKNKVIAINTLRAENKNLSYNNILAIQVMTNSFNTINWTLAEIK